MIEDIIKKNQEKLGGEAENNSTKKIIFRLKRKADETPLENLILENYYDQYSMFQQQEKEKVNRKKVKVGKKQEQEQENTTEKEEQKEQDNPVDQLTQLFEKQKSIFQDNNASSKQEKQLVLRRIADAEKPLREYQFCLSEEIRSNKRQEQFNKFRKIDNGQQNTNNNNGDKDKQGQNVIDIQYNKDKKTLELDDKENKPIITDDDIIDDYYILEQPQQPKEKMQIGEDLWLIDGVEYKLVNYGNDMKKFLVQDSYGQEIVFDETKYSDPECDRDSQDSNRSSNPNNTYPSESSHNSDFSNEEQSDEEDDEDENHDDDSEYDQYDHENDSDMDEETYYMKKQGFQQQRNKKKRKNRKNINEDSDSDKASFNSQEFDYEEFEENFQTFLAKQQVMQMKQKDHEDFDYDNDF